MKANKASIDTLLLNAAQTKIKEPQKMTKNVIN